MDAIFPLTFCEKVPLNTPVARAKENVMPVGMGLASAGTFVDGHVPFCVKVEERAADGPIVRVKLPVADVPESRETPVAKE